MNIMIDQHNLKKENWQTDPEDVLNDFKLFIGPWIALFNGKIKTTNGQKWEEKIFDAVDKFCGNK